MNDYFQYLRQMFETVMYDIGNWFKMTFADPWGELPSNFSKYNDLFGAYYQSFGFWGWFFFVLVALLLIGLIGGILFLLFILIRKYVKFYKTEVAKEKLIEEIQKLNYELYKSSTEKNKILNLKVDALGLGTTPGQKGVEEGEAEQSTSLCRFPKLEMVDKKYADMPFHTEMQETDKITLEQLVNKFRFFAASQLGLYYEVNDLRAFFAGLGTTKVIILEGISGTGKTSLPYALGKFFQNNAKICSVQPSWRDRSELLGYYNEFTKKFNETDFLRAVYEATYRDDCSVVVLDEMNLARIEYYFAEFLSIMEMPNVSEWNIELINSPDPNSDPKHIKDGKLLIPQNVWFIGTANNDDSTFTITDKVYDRAISVFFDNKGIAFDCEFTEPIGITYEYLNNLYKEAGTNFPISQKTLEKFDRLDDFVIAKFKLAVGNRILKQLKTFAPIYVACGGTELEAFDYIFATKILKKFETLNIAFLKDELNELDAFLDKQYGKNVCKESKKTIANLLKMN